MRRRTYLGGLLTGGLTALAGCAAAGDGVGDVDMSKNAYLPQSIEITVGETVTWVNNSSRGHSVTAYEDAIPADAAYWASGGFESERSAREAFHNADPWGNIKPGQSYERRFDVAGTHGYFCIPHERAAMVGAVNVRAP